MSLLINGGSSQTVCKIRVGERNNGTESGRKHDIKGKMYFDNLFSYLFEDPFSLLTERRVTRYFLARGRREKCKRLKN